VGQSKIQNPSGKQRGFQRRPLWRAMQLDSLLPIVFFALLCLGSLHAQIEEIAPPASTAPTGPPVAVHGIVRNAVTGQPLARALVRLEGESDTGALTDSEGRFEIPGVALGTAVFKLTKPGYQDASSVPTLYYESRPEDVEHVIQVSAQMPELSFAMTPNCAIRGRIELSTGDPAEQIQVQLLRRTVQEGRAIWMQAANTRTSSDGSYRFGGLSDGVYAVYTNPTLESEPASDLAASGSAGRIARSGYASTFYPDAHELSGAAKIKVSKGEEALANFQLMLEPFQMVTASVTLPHNSSGSEAGGAAQSYIVSVLDSGGHQLPYNAQYDQGTHAIQALLPDGSYTLIITSRLGRTSILNEGFDFSINAQPLVGTVDFSVAGHPLSNLRVPLSLPRGNTVQLTLNHSASSQAQTGAASNTEGPAHVMLSPAGASIDNILTYSYAEDSRPGPMKTSFTPPGSYWVHTQVGISGYCEQSFTAGGASLAREPLAVGLSGATAPMELTLRDDCAQLTLSLSLALAASVSPEEHAYTVYVVPDFDSTVDIEPVTLRPSSGGTVTLRNLTPGSYHVYTFDTPVALEYSNPAALAALPTSGQTVTLSPGASANLVLEAPGQ
jgi:hypothetical protein